MLGLDNPIHLAFILVLLLLVFGAKRLPEMGRSLGSGLRGFKESISGQESISSITEHAPRPVDDLGASAVHADAPVEDPQEPTPAQPVAQR